MSKAKDLATPEQKLKALSQLQTIDSKIDEIRVLRGELPIEVKDLEDEIVGLSTRLRNLEKEKQDMQTLIRKHETNIAEAKGLIIKYNAQLLNVKNNREYDALNKEIEMQQLEIELSQKRMRETQSAISQKDTSVEDSKKKIASREKDLAVKQKELVAIVSDTEKEEKDLLQKSKNEAANIEARLITAYNRIRTTYRNGLAVVPIERDSCGGCFGKIPPQKQLEIRTRKKIILCEHCGRILVDPILMEA